jgi:hypothetical protein
MFFGLKVDEVDKEGRKFRLFRINAPLNFKGLTQRRKQFYIFVVLRTLSSRIVYIQVVTVSSFMERDDSLPYSQKPTTGLHSAIRNLMLFSVSGVDFNIIPHYAFVFQVTSSMRILVLTAASMKIVF